jgi:hypothetical protein
MPPRKNSLKDEGFYVYNSQFLKGYSTYKDAVCH